MNAKLSKLLGGSPEFYKALFSLVIPITVQNLLTSAVNLADVFMLGFVGQDALAAVSLANQYQFILIGVYFGIASGITIMCSQYWGKKDVGTIQAVMGIALKLSMGFTAIIMVLSLTVPRALMLLYTNDEDLIATGVVYLKIVGVSYFIMSISTVYEATLRSVERTALSTALTSVALVLNVVLNAVFIFGLFGAPKLGVAGVALATLISRVVELVLCLGDYLRGKVFRPDWRKLLGHNGVLMGDFIKFAVPAMANDIIWTLAFSTYAIILGHLNADMVAANAVVTNVRDVCTVMCFGFASGGSVLLGKTVGEGRLDDADKMAGDLCKVTLFVSICTMCLILLLTPVIPLLFTLTERARSYLRGMMLISSYYIIGQAMNTLLIAGIFRVGGNTRFGLICDTVTMWCVAVPIGFISAFVLKLPPMWVYFILCLDEFWKVPVVIRYYRSKKWLRNITRDIPCEEY